MVVIRAGQMAGQMAASTVDGWVVGTAPWLVDGRAASMVVMWVAVTAEKTAGITVVWRVAWSVVEKAASKVER